MNMMRFSFYTAIIIWIGGLIYFGYTINHYQPDTATHTDAIVALTGGRNRITEAVKLLNQNKADKLFISGVDKNTTLKNIQKTQKIKSSRFSQIQIGHDAENTVENAIETKQWVDANHITSIRLVTSNYHIARSLLEFKIHIPEAEIIPHPVYSEHIEKKWWTSWQTFSLIFREYNKFIYTLIKYMLQIQ